jgi:transposase
MNQVGIDISSKVFDATMQQGSKIIRKQFSNTKSGHRLFISWALRQANSAQICLEATGIYHLQLALALDRHADTEVMIVNPCAARRFAQAHMVRAKTDAIDADGLLQYLQRMPFRSWAAPREEVLQLQSLAHRVAQLDKEIIRERSRLHAARRAGPHTYFVQQDIQAHIKQLQRRLERMKSQPTADFRFNQTYSILSTGIRSYMIICLSFVFYTSVWLKHHCWSGSEYK